LLTNVMYDILIEVFLNRSITLDQRVVLAQLW